MRSNKALVDVWSIRLEVESMDDHVLIDELDLICNEPFMDLVISNYLDAGIIEEDDREKMIAYYILVYCIDEIEID